MSDERVEYTFLWLIENYSYCWHRNGEKLISPCFTANELESTSWRLGVYPNGAKDEEKGYISLSFGRNLVDEGPKNVSLTYELSVLDSGGSYTPLNGSKRSFVRNTAFEWPKFLKIENDSPDNLIVRCRAWKGKGNVRKVAPICAKTRIAVENISFLHVVENFSTLHPNQKMTVKIPSHSKAGSFISSSLHYTQDSSFEGDIIMEITLPDDNYILSKRKISLLGSSGNVVNCCKNDNRFDSERKDIQKLPLSLSRQIILHKKSEYLLNDKLILFCECAFSIRQKHRETGEIMTAAVKQATNPAPNKSVANTIAKASAYTSGLEDIITLYVNQCLTDVELKTETKSFPAHNVVLCIRSSIFEAMLTSDMRENRNSCIEVNDLSDDTVQQLLLFLYSDNVENLHWNVATQLYYAGDKYEIGQLQEICSSFLMEHLNANNAGELLILADTHNDEGLKKYVEDFILEYDEQVFGSIEWEMIIEKNPTLASKTMHLKYKRKK